MQVFAIGKQLDYLAVVETTLGEGLKFVCGGPGPVHPADIPECDLIVLQLPGTSKDDQSNEYSCGIEQLRQLVLNPTGIPVIAFLRDPDRQTIRDVVAAGAYDYFVESSSMPELRIVLRRAVHFHELRAELERVQEAAKNVGELGQIVAADPKMLELMTISRRIAHSDAAVLITGETGTGKEVLAAAIHGASPRKRYPFVAVACSALPETLIEAELFGHEKGAFTGATQARTGRFEAAGRGTIFIDEVGELSPSLQVKLLRVLQNCTFERIGSNRGIPMQARVICATNRNLKLLVKAARFRADLYYRLNTIELGMPALRERPDDITPLAHLFLHKYSDAQGRPARRIGAAALSAMKSYSWPGNVRELEHVMERAVVMCEGPEIRIEHLPEDLCKVVADGIESGSFEYEVRRFKRRLIQQTLMQNQNNKIRTANVLQISRSSLHRLIVELGIGAAGLGPEYVMCDDILRPVA